MWGEDSNFKKRIRPLLGVVLTVLMVCSAVFLVTIGFFSWFKKSADASHWLLVGQGMILIILGCLAVYCRSCKEILKAERCLEEKIRDLETERALRRGVEEELKQTLEGADQRLEEQILHSAVIEQTEDNVLITDSHRTIIYINPAFERSCGYTCDELRGQPLRNLRSDQHDKAFFQTMKEVLDRGEVWTGVIINRGRGDIDFEIEGTISPIRDTTGSINHWVAVGRNMSRFRKLEQELQRVQKMDALGTLAGGIAHDFNNVLAAVMGLIEIEYMGAETGSRTRNRMEQALAACSRARDLVKQILTFSSQGRGQRRRPLRIGPVVEEALQMLRATLPATITIQTDLEAAEALILGESSQIHQVLLNLCTNAAHAMKQSGGVLGIMLKKAEIDNSHAFEHPDLRPGSYLRLTVSDTGEGMKQQVRERIFEPFFTTKRPGEGAGVGLSVVHGIVKGHGGKIVVRSEPGKGSTFELYFPMIEGMEERPEILLPPSPAGDERILLVDDEELVVSVASEMLIGLGYEVVSVQRSPEALELFRLEPQRFHLIITDQTMPDMTGMELAAEVLRIRRNIPIILCTGYSDEKVRKTASAIGIQRILAKPFVLQELATSVRDALNHH
jgi:PAS domain S-box-containing protein